MSGLDWYKHAPKDFLKGVIGMPPELIGAYIVVIDLIYLHGGPIPNDARWLAGNFNCSARMAATLVARLLDLRKLTLKDGYLDNARAANEIENQSEYSRKQSENGAKGGRKVAEKQSNAKQNSDLVQATPKPIEKIREEEKERDNPAGCTPAPAPANLPAVVEIPVKAPPRATRLPVDWTPAPLPAEIAAIVALWMPGMLERTLANFRDYFAASSSARAAKLDWDAAWRSWIRREDKENGQRSGNDWSRNRGGGKSTVAAMADALSRMGANGSR